MSITPRSWIVFCRISRRSKGRKCWCTAAARSPLNWDEKTKKRVFYENENTQEMEFYNEVKYFSSKMVSEGKDKAVLIVNPYMVNVHEEEHLAKLEPYYEIGERKEVKLLQGSIVYYELTRK